jgi:hypothetical protein
MVRAAASVLERAEVVGGSGRDERVDTGDCEQNCEKAAHGAPDALGNPKNIGAEAMRQRGVHADR